VVIGVERDGLEEWVLQPLRHEQLRRGIIVPIQGYKAPRGKLAFIAALQPFLNAGEITFAKDMAALKQFLSFPTGKIDFVNALAFALLMRPGQPIYEDLRARTSPMRSCPQAARHRCGSASTPPRW